MLAQIKVSNDRVGLDTKGDSEGEEDRVDYVGAQTEISKVLEYDFKAGLVGWSPNLKLEHSDFLRTKRTTAVFVPANLDMKLRLDAEIDEEYGPREFLFRQKPRIGKIIALPPALTLEPKEYLFLHVTRATKWDRVQVENLYLCMENLRDKS